MMTLDRSHCAQGDEQRYAADFARLLRHGYAPRRRYVPRRRGDVFTIDHYGQRKLLMSEIELLIRVDPSKHYTLVYAGAAPGIHIPLLSELFPNITFHLYDPGVFQINETDRIRLFNTYFTDEEAGLYVEVPNLIFVCDIRRSPDELLVWEDMLAQQRWHMIMRPVLTSLKFRLPWPENGVVFLGRRVTRQHPRVLYLDGDIHLPIWGRTQTTESRLVIDERFYNHQGRPMTRLYDCFAYEEEMCYFNRVIRPSTHNQPLRAGGLDACYDCAAEVAVLDQYIASRGDLRTVAALSALVTERLGRGISA